MDIGSAGDVAGLKAGDLIVRMDGEPIKHRENFVTVVRKVSFGELTSAMVDLRCGLEMISLAVWSKAAAPKFDQTSIAIEPRPAPDPRILNAQRWLQRAGFDPGPADGFWGHKTALAVKAFQRWYPNKKLAATGQLDQQTYAALQDAGSRQARPKRSKAKPVAKFCTQCGAAIMPGAKFCIQCGAKVPR